ncbi:MAG: L,D-transpeptidase, partial [Atopobiaceae bacterium]|nr:L,D-transpeptidase [Atopobiaceae bacterium]
VAELLRHALSAQDARVYRGDEVIWESYIVSGKTSDGHGTPTGVYAVNDYKGMYQTLIGLDENHDGEPDYKTKVTYWIPFIDNLVAFHDADWRYSFGGEIYVWNGSHGCINLPYYKAEELYGIAELGTVVVVHW